MSGWLGGLGEALAGEVMRHSAAWHVPARQVLARQGAVPDVWFGVAAGAVKLSTLAENGRESLLDVLEPGQWFGDVPLLTGEPQPYTAQTWSPSTLLVMRRSTLRQLLTAHASLAAALARLNWERCARVMERLELRAETRARERTLKQLRRLAARFGRRHGMVVRIEMGLTQSDLALLIDASRQRANEMLKALERAGELRVGRGYVELVNAVAASGPSRMAHSS